MMDGILSAMKKKKLGEESESPEKQAMETATGTEGTPEDNLEDAEQGEELADEDTDGVGDDTSEEAGESAGTAGETEMDMAEQGDEAADTAGVKAALAKLRGGGGAEMGGDPGMSEDGGTPEGTAVKQAAAEQGIALDEITGSDLLELLEMGGLGAELVMGAAESTGDGALGALLAKSPGKPAMSGMSMPKPGGMPKSMGTYKGA